MKRVLAALVLSAACGGGGTSAETPQTQELVRWSAPQASANDVLLAARGDVVVLGTRISHDAGATWSAIDPAIGELKGIAIVGQQAVVYGSTTGLARWDLATGTLTPVAGAPSYTTDRTWRAAPDGRALVFDPIENEIAVESSSGWTTGSLPQPAPTELKPYVKDIASNGSVIIAVSGWGVHRSTNGGSTWTLATSANDPRDVVVLGDGRFVVVNAGTAILLDASGMPAGTLPDFTVAAGDATVCEDGAIVAKNQVTLDLGATWHTLTAGGDLAMQVQRAGCGAGRYWVLALSDIWGYRFVRYDGLDAPGIAAGNWGSLGDQPWTSGGPAIARMPDGTFLVGGWALPPTATDWILRETPSRTWTSGGALFGVQDGQFFTSDDGGVTWHGTQASGLTVTEPEAFARGADGSLYVSQFTGGTDPSVDTWHSTVWKSSDGGATWTVAYDSVATRGADDTITGEAHRFVGLLPDGAWVSTDATSRDGGATWDHSDVVGDRGLAHLALDGSLVTGGADEKLWRVYDDGGLGELRATYQLSVEGERIPASQLRSVAFDEEGYVYVARGTPYAQIWRSSSPVTHGE